MQMPGVAGVKARASGHGQRYGPDVIANLIVCVLPCWLGGSETAVLGTCVETGSQP